MAEIKLRNANIIFESPAEAIEHETSMDNVVKISVKNNAGKTAYISKSKGDFDDRYSIPNGDTAVFTAATGFKFSGAFFIHYGPDGTEVGTAIITKQVVS